MNWLVYGVGAIGTYIGGSLILQGQKVAFLERPESIAFLRESGLRLYIQGQDYRILHPDVFSDLKEALEFENYDVVIFALKSFDTQSALEIIRPFAPQFPPVLCLQNGVENEPALEGILGKDRVIAGTVTSSVRRVGVGDIVLERTRGMGVCSTNPLSMNIAQALSRANLNAHQFASPASMKWSKMLTNLLANTSAAILDMPPAQILEHPGLYQLEIIQLREAISVMHALGVPVINLPGVPVRIFASAVDHLPPHLSRPFISRMAGKGRGEKMPSFHIDLYSGRGKSEVDFLNGAVVRFGQRVGFATPVNNWLCQTLLDEISGSIPRDEYIHQPEKLLSHVFLSEEID